MMVKPSNKPALCPSSCQPDTRPDIHPNCTEEEEKGFEAQCAQVILSDRFKPCHSVVSAKAFLSNCIYDMCEYNGMQSTLCDNIDAYAQACKSAGVTISWRNSTFCRELYVQRPRKSKVAFPYIKPLFSPHSNALPTKQPLLGMHSAVPAHMLRPLSPPLPPPINHLRGGLSV